MLVLLPLGWLAGSVLMARRDLPQSGGFQSVARELTLRQSPSARVLDRSG